MVTSSVSKKVPWTPHSSASTAACARLPTYSGVSSARPPPTNGHVPAAIRSSIGSVQRRSPGPYTALGRRIVSRTPQAGGVQAGGALRGELGPRVRRRHARAAAFLVQVATVAAGVGRSTRARRVRRPRAPPPPPRLTAPATLSRSKSARLPQSLARAAQWTTARQPAKAASRPGTSSSAAGASATPGPSARRARVSAARPHRADHLLPAGGERGSARVADETRSPGDRRHGSRP